VSEALPVALRAEADVREVIREIIQELAPAPSADRASEARLVEDLEYTSLALLELAFTLEDEFELPPIDEETARKIATVGDVENHVVAGLREEGRLAA
jgi:acyl carrier protein